jgi:polysaccharide deacetylase family protein (PEP-CTERM system associated)
MPITNRLTVDFEEWFHGLTSTGKNPGSWGRFDRRIEIGARFLLDAFAQRNIRATFFIVGAIADHNPEIVKEIADAGHEIALHGHQHGLVYHMNQEQFAADLAQNRDAVAQASGKAPVGYRAPCFSINSSTPWIFEEVARAGLLFDASVFPVKTPLYGLPDAPRKPHQVTTAAGPIHEYPMSVTAIRGKNFPYSGGFYFRALPYGLSRRIIKQANSNGESVVFYCHPWEFDPAHPKPPEVTLRERLSHYGFLTGARQKFIKLLDDFTWGPLGEGTVEQSNAS